MPTPAAVHMESLVAGLVPVGRGPSRVPIAKSSDGSPRAPPAEGLYPAHRLTIPGGPQRQRELHGDATLHEILARIHHEGCGGMAEAGGPAAGIEGVSSHPVRWILLL